MEAKDFYRDNVAFLYRHFGSFKDQARFFMAPVPFEVKYELSLKKGGAPIQTIRLVPASIPIGALFLCWDLYPEYFQVTKDGKTGYVYSFNGSPLSGANCWSAVVLETGETFSGHGDPHFRIRCQALHDAVIRSRKAVAAFQRESGHGDLTPASLEEIVAFISVRCN